MATFSSLKTRFFNWMGIVDVTSTETLRVEEILNAAVALVLSEGVPGLQQTMTGVSRGTLAVTVSSHSANSSSVTLAETLTGVYPRDLFEAPDGNTYVIADVTGSVIDLGIPILDALDTSGGTIHRRSFPLPHNGQILSVADAGGRSLEPSPLAPTEGSYERGRGMYTVSYCHSLTSSFVTIYPTPAAGVVFTLIQSKAVDDDTGYAVPDSQVYPVLMRAISLWRMINDEENAVVAGQTQAAKDDSSDINRTNPGSGQVLVR